MEIAIAVNFGNAYINLKADDLDEFKLGMSYLESQGILTRNGGQPADTAMMANVDGAVLQNAQATETRAEEKPKANRKPKKEDAKAEPAPEDKEEAKAAESDPAPEARAVTKEDVMNAVSAYGNALAATGLSETDAVAKIRADLYSKYEIKRAGELPEARWGEFVAEVSALTEALAKADGAPAEDENLL